MERRDMLRALAVGAAKFAPLLVQRRSAGQVIAPHEVHGGGPVLFLGSPISVSKNEPAGDPIAAMRLGYLDRLTDRYRVVVMDYPPGGSAARDVVASFDPDHVCADVLAVANAIGADQFAWYGYSWGGVVGLQLAARTDRLSALICGGWPPLGASYSDVKAQAEWLAGRVNAPEAQLMVTYYRALEGWQDEDALSRIRCPRMTFAGRDDVITAGGYTTRIGPLLAERQSDLERAGWIVRLVEGSRHDLFARPDVVVPLMRDFLDPVLLRP